MSTLPQRLVFDCRILGLLDEAVQEIISALTCAEEGNRCTCLKLAIRESRKCVRSKLNCFAIILR